MCDWQEERLRRGDDLRLQMAIEESKREKLKPEEVCVKSACLSLTFLALSPLAVSPTISLSQFSQFSVHVHFDIVLAVI